MPECLYNNLGVFGINIWGFDEKTGRYSLPIQSEGLLFARKNATLTEVAPLCLVSHILFLFLLSFLFPFLAFISFQFHRKRKHRKLSGVSSLRKKLQSQR